MEKVELVFQVSCFQLRESAIYVMIPAYLKMGKKDLFYQFERKEYNYPPLDLLSIFIWLEEGKVFASKSLGSNGNLVQ